jgi:uncharacterized membrane protein YdjX (TVP38/TMEM64 family)
MINKLWRRGAIKWLFIIILVFLVSGSFLKYFPEEKIETLLDRAGYGGPIIVILFIALSEVMAPLPGSPAILASLAIFGWDKTVVYSFVGLNIAVIVNFWLSRVFGRNLILKMFGNKYLEQIDLFTHKQGKTTLLLGRTIGYPFSDFISYASGLTNIKFSTYLIISFLGLVVSHIVFMSIFRHLNFDATQDFVFWIIIAGLFSAIFGWIIKRHIK